jgi:energy-coupling factor transporter transmembrane protein EcfT
MILLSILTMVFNGKGLSLISLLISVIFVISKIKILDIFKQSRFFILLIIIIFFGYGLSDEGNMIFNVYNFKIYDIAIHKALVQCWKFVLLVLFGIFFTETTAPESFQSAIYYILKPIPLVNERKIASISGTTLVLLPKILDTYKDIINALHSRCYSNNKNIYYKIKNLSQSLILTSVLSIKNISEAYFSRFYDENKVQYYNSVNKKDSIIFLCLLLFLLTSLIYNFSPFLFKLF